jgi:hypothetical protein
LTPSAQRTLLGIKPFSPLCGTYQNTALGKQKEAASEDEEVYVYYYESTYSAKQRDMEPVVSVLFISAAPC